MNKEREIDIMRKEENGKFKLRKTLTHSKHTREKVKERDREREKERERQIENKRKNER